MASSSLEEKALERKERLKALKRKREGDSSKDANKNSSTEAQSLPK